MGRTTISALLILSSFLFLGSFPAEAQRSERKEVMIVVDDGITGDVRIPKTRLEVFSDPVTGFSVPIRAPVPGETTLIADRTREFLQAAKELGIRLGFAVVTDAPSDPREQDQYFAWFERWFRGGQFGQFKGGLNTPEQSAILAQLVREGHVLINHGAHHMFFGMMLRNRELRKATKEEIKQEIMLAQKHLEDLGYEVRWVRPPYFAATPEFWEAIKELNEKRIQEGKPPLGVIMGEGRRENAASGDVTPWATVEDVQNYIADLLKEHNWTKPFILTIHATPESVIDGPALRRIVQWLEEHGYKVVDFNPFHVAIFERPSNVRSTENRLMTGVEAGPVVPGLLPPFVPGGAPGHGVLLLDIRRLLPTRGPTGTTMVGPLPVPQALTMGNGVEAWAVEFRSKPGDSGTTKAVVMVIKTLREAYRHDPGVCYRYHLNTLRSLTPFPVVRTTVGGGLQGRASWFWECEVQMDGSGGFEDLCQFAAVVDEANRHIVVDSRWVDKQYCVYWRHPRARYDYMLNFQVWSPSAGETTKLLREVLAKLDEVGDGWKFTFANEQCPAEAPAFVEEAWYTGRAVYLRVMNCLSAPAMACFHGTKQHDLGGQDHFFEYWKPLRPGSNVLQLPVSGIHNAVVHCELAGFVDKVFVSVDRQQDTPAFERLPPVFWLQRSHNTPASVTISWPRPNAKVPVLRDQLNMPDDDDGKRVAIHGTAAGAPPGATVEVLVYSDKWYPPDPVMVQDGLWGFRVRLCGQGKFNNHTIYVRMLDANGKEIAADRVDGIVRIDSVGMESGLTETQRSAADQVLVPQWNPIEVEANKFRADSGCDRQAIGVLIIGGTTGGPHGRGGSASCQVELPEDVSKPKLRISVWHGTPSEFGKGIHSARQGGTVTFYVNDVPVHTIVCRHRGMYGDFWPEARPELGRQVPEIDLAAKGINGRTLTIKFVASPWTCMDLRSITVKPLAQ